MSTIILSAAIFLGCLCFCLFFSRERLGMREVFANIAFALLLWCVWWQVQHGWVSVTDERFIIALRTWAFAIVFGSVLGMMATHPPDRKTITITWTL